MNLDTERKILDKIKEYDKIIISRHIRPDGDASGSTLGLRRVLRDSFPSKKVFVINDDYAQYTEFLGSEDEQLDDEEYQDALVLVLDTADTERVSNSKFNLGKEIIKIDHHIDNKPFGDIFWVEDNRSSTCEMVSEFCFHFKDELVMTKEAATFLFTGLVTDSGRFRFSDVSPETLRCAAMLLETGIDTEYIYSNLYMEDFYVTKINGMFASKIKITENGVAYLYVSSAARKKAGISMETTSNLVGIMSEIKDSIIWLGFFQDDEGAIRVRLRSRFVTINALAEKYGGGGHACASGATVHSGKEMKALIEDADKLIKEYKMNNRGWL